jgi:hypothetical protein
MRAVFGIWVRSTKNSIRALAAMLLTLSAVLAPLAAAPATYAEGPDADIPASEESDQQKLELANGNPTATSAADVKLEGATISWTPTGIGDIQDTYELVVARQNRAEGSNTLTQEIVMSQVGLTEAKQDVAALGEGTFYWQVRSCVVNAACKEWSEAYAVNIDGAAPDAPIATVSSGQYDRTVSLSGTAEANGKVTAQVGEATCRAAVDTTGAWNCTLPGEMEFGDYEALVTAFDDVGNASQAFTLAFSVKELFVAPPIKAEELPAVLEVVPVSTVAENKVFKQPISVIDSVNMGQDISEPAGSVLGAAVHPLSTEGGIVQPSESGWQVFGMPWFMWAGVGGILSAGWFVYSGRSLRSFSFS